MGKHKDPTNNNPNLPEVHTALCYNDLWKNYKSIDPLALINDMPTVALLNFMVDIHKKVEYAYSDTATQKQIIRDLISYLPVKDKQKVFHFFKRHDYPFLISHDTAIYFYSLALSNYCSMDDFEDTDLELTQEEESSSFKAILYCNQLWSDSQVADDLSNMDVIDLSILIDIPISEYKFNKDFRPQIFKAIQFFSFCEKDPNFKNYLSAFLKDVGTGVWNEYIFILFLFLADAIEKRQLTMKDELTTFLSRYIIDTSDPLLKGLWQLPTKNNYFRNKFIFPIDKDSYLLLSNNFLVDKIYQGLIFDFYDSITKNGLLQPNQKPFTSYGDFKGLIGNVFSEQHLLYPLMDKIFDNNCSAKFSGEELKTLGIVGEPDYYVRQGEVLYLFEYKDVTLADEVKQSKDIDRIKDTILDRVCCHKTNEKGKTRIKGAGQLLEVMNKIVNSKDYDKVDSQISKIKYIAPIVITTDTVYNCNGVNQLVITEFSDILSANYKIEKVLIQVPILLDYDTLVKLTYPLSNKEFIFFDLISGYINSPKRLGSFKSYIDDNVLKGRTITDAENRFLFKELFRT